MSKNKHRPTPIQTETSKAEVRRQDLNNRLENLRAEASIHRERLVRRSELLGSCEREVKDAQARLRAAEERRSNMIANIEKAPGEIVRLEGEMSAVKQELATMDHAVMIAKAKDLATQIAALQAMGFKITPPGGAA